MRVIIAPAKKMNSDLDSFPPETLPQFLDRAERLMLALQARLSVDGHKDLYGFWGARLADQLAAETDLVLNLASKEYSRAVEPHLPPDVRFLTCTFGELKGGKVVEKGTVCKMARGQMVRWLAENNVTGPENIKNFADLDCRFSSTRSTENRYVFICEKDRDSYTRNLIVAANGKDNPRISSWTSSTMRQLQPARSCRPIISPASCWT